MSAKGERTNLVNGQAFRFKILLISSIGALLHMALRMNITGNSRGATMLEGGANMDTGRGLGVQVAFQGWRRKGGDRDAPCSHA